MKLDVSIEIILDESSLSLARFQGMVGEDGKKLYKLIYNEKMLKSNTESVSKEKRFNYLFYAIIFILALELEKNFPLTSCYYLPAARSNLVQGYKPLLSEMAKNLQLSVINPSDNIEIPSFSGV